MSWKLNYVVDKMKKKIKIAGAVVLVLIGLMFAFSSISGYIEYRQFEQRCKDYEVGLNEFEGGAVTNCRCFPFKVNETQLIEWGLGENIMDKVSEYMCGCTCQSGNETVKIPIVVVSG